MNSKYLLSFAVFSFLTITTPVFAESSVSPKPTIRLRQEMNTQRSEAKVELKDNRQIVHTTIAQTRADFNKKRIQITQQGLLNAFSRRFDALIKYQTMVQTRLSTKKDKLLTNQNLIDAQKRLENVTNLLIPTYNTDYTNFKAKFDQIATPTDPKNLLPDLKSLAKTVEQDLKNVRSELVSSLRLVVRAK